MADAATEQVTRWWIIVHEPGLAPEKKNPHHQTDDGAEDMLIQLALCRPPGTRYTLARLTWDQDLWVSEGGEEISIAFHAAPRRFARKVRHVAQANATWLRADAERIRLVARGQMP